MRLDHRAGAAPDCGAKSPAMQNEQSQGENARVPFGMVLASIAGLWLCYFLLTTLRALVLDLGFEQDMLWRRALVLLAGIVITLGLWLVLRLFDARPLWAKLAAALLLSLPVSVVLAQANQSIFADMESKVYKRIEARHSDPQATASAKAGSGAEVDSDPDPNPEGDILGDVSFKGGDPSGSAGQRETIGNAQPVLASEWQAITEIAFGRYFMMLAWCALYLALLTGQSARAAERREGDFRRAAKAAELRSLRYQVNPHFLFNTLNSLSALVLTGKIDVAERMIQTLSTFYRRSLADDPTSDVRLSEEFELQKLYLDIEEVRFPQRLQAEFVLPEELADARIPGMILQPLVENSVKHAVAATLHRVTITLAAQIEYGRLVLTVSDNGNDLEANTRPGFGIGLANVRERLAARFGNDASVVSGRIAGGYSTVLRLPILLNGEEQT
jgi:hypothetical protein